MRSTGIEAVSKSLKAFIYKGFSHLLAKNTPIISGFRDRKFSGDFKANFYPIFVFFTVDRSFACFWLVRFFDLIWYAKIISFDFTGTFAGTLWPIYTDKYTVIYSDIHPNLQSRLQSHYSRIYNLQGHLQSHCRLMSISFINMFLKKGTSYSKNKDVLIEIYLSNYLTRSIK